MPKKFKRPLLRRIDLIQNGQNIGFIMRRITAQRSPGRFWLPGSRDKNGNRPFIVSYDYNFYVLKSRKGDLADPKTRDDSYIENGQLYIELPDPNTCTTCGGKFETQELTGAQYLLCPKCNEISKVGR